MDVGDVTLLIALGAAAGVVLGSRAAEHVPGSHVQKLDRARESDERLEKVAKDAGAIATVAVQHQKQSDAGVYRLSEAMKNIDWFMSFEDDAPARPRQGPAGAGR